ncbi:hypothetical protein SHXM_00188 [Streptomyces hygroscopicus]|nr:hypothetical protein SHXM_00188 [Streptomyces hygroscopicus]
MSSTIQLSSRVAIRWSRRKDMNHDPVRPSTLFRSLLVKRHGRVTEPRRSSTGTKNEIMCRAYGNADGTWLINPMFIDPLPRREAAYPCSTTGYINSDGTMGPVRRQDGSVIPDKEDSVHGG